jgi:hypothetical protein
MHQRLLALALICSASAPLVAQESAPAPVPSPAARLDSAATIELGRKYTAWFYSDLGDSLVAHSSDQVKEKITAAQLSEFLAQLVSQVGNEVSVVAESVVAKDTLTGYLREAEFEMIDEPLVVAFTIGGNGDIYGFFIRPKSQMPAAQPN